MSNRLFLGRSAGVGVCLAVALSGGFSFAASAAAQDAVSPGRAKADAEASATSTTSSASTRKSATAGTDATAGTTQTTTTTTTEPRLIVMGDELPSAYGAPGAFSRSRFSPLVAAYVLPPGSVYAALLYEGDAFREGKPDHIFTQEVEVGLPHRFGVAAENRIEHFDGDTENSSFSVEARYALADWGKIPLNPTIFAEYKFGIGKILHEEGPPPPPGEEEEEDEDGPPNVPDAYEFRLLLAQDFGEHVEWAFNAFFERENVGDRGREWGFAQSIQVPLGLEHERFKIGAEMQYQNFTVKDTRGNAINRFGIGPSASFKPSARCRLDVTTLFGTTDDTAAVGVFAVFSYVFGGPEGQGAEAPTSTQNR